MNKNRQAPDLWLLICILALLAIGIVMVYSAGSVLAFHDYGDKFYFVKRQLFFACLGLAAMYFTSKIDFGSGRSIASLRFWPAFSSLLSFLFRVSALCAAGPEAGLASAHLAFSPLNL